MKVYKMSNKYEQRFFSALKDTFVGHKIKGKSGYVNLLDLKQQYFAQIEPFIKKEIDETIDEPAREELYEKLYSFFDSYLNETGTVFFANSQLHKNLYERVYSDRDDVSLFWKTQKLYYVKSEAMYDDLETEISGITYIFDASDIKHAKGNEKKSLVFFLTDVQPKRLTFKVRYQEQLKYDRLKEYLEIEKPNDIKDYLIENYDNKIHKNVNVIKNNIERDMFTKKGDLRDCIFFNNIDDLIKSVSVEFSPSKIELIHQYCNAKTVICTEDEIKKAFHIYKKQNEVDYFIHKDADGFLKEQFDIYTYNWLFNDLKTDFDAQTVARIQNIKRIAHKVIEYIAKFENELKAIWEKPKFVRNSNYVFTLDRLFPIKETKDDGTVVRDFEDKESLELVKKIVEHKGFEEQQKEWNRLFLKQESENKVIKKEWKEFENLAKLKKSLIIQDKNFKKEYRYIPIDTKYYNSFKSVILSHFLNIEKKLDGILIKSDNYQLLKSFYPKFKERIDYIYIDPPFNTGSDFLYKDNFQDSTWCSLMEDRLELSKELLSNRGRLSVHLDYNATYFLRIILNKLFGKTNYIDSIMWVYGSPSGGRAAGAKLVGIHNEILNYSKYYKKRINNKIYLPYSQKYLDEWFKYKDENGRVYRKRFYGTGNWKKQYLDESLGVPGSTVWDDIKQVYADPRAYKDDQRHLSEIMLFDTQKPERLLKRLIDHSTLDDSIVMDYFSGSGTTICTAHKMKKQWLGCEFGEHIEEMYWDADDKQYKIGIKGRLLKVLNSDSTGISKEVNWKGGGFFKYYELEQYEDVLARALYQWREKESDVEQYSFMQDQKLLEALEIDYEKKNVKVVFERLYPDVDIAETLSNLSGKPIKELAKDYCVLVDRETEEEMKIVYDEMTFEKYPWIKPLIWWHSK